MNSTETSTRTLTASDVIGLAQVIETRNGHGKVVRTIDGKPVFGHARYLTGEDGGPQPEDVRDAYLRVTLYSGFEVFWPVAELAREMYHGQFVSYNWTHEQAREER